MSAVHPYLADQLDKTAMFVRSYIVVGKHELTAIVLWNAASYVYHFARATPYLHAYSPEPGSGKTTLLDILELTARNAVQADGLSEAALYRMIAKKRPTLLVDEVDTIFGKRHADSSEGIRQVLNSGYRRGKVVWRCVPPSHEVEPFDVYCPKALAGLNELPGTLAHRAIPIAMQPPLPSDVYEELDAEEIEEEAEILGRSLQSWADEAGDVLQDRSLRPPRLAGLDARGNEIWRILFRIAAHAGSQWPGMAEEAALELSGRDRHEHVASSGVRLLGDIRDLFEDERMFCFAMAAALNMDDQLPYGGWNEGKGISTRELGRKLAAYRIRAKTIRIVDKRAHGYERDQFEEAWSRYLAENAPPNRDTVQTRQPSQEQPERNRDKEGPVTVSENGANPHRASAVTVVALSGGESGAGDIPLPGDDDFLALLAEAHRNGQITEGEANERWSLHRLALPEPKP